LDHAGTTALSNGNRDLVVSDSSGIKSTLKMESGKWYWQFRVLSGYIFQIGVCNETFISGAEGLGWSTNAWACYDGGNYYHNGSGTSSGFGTWPLLL